MCKATEYINQLMSAVENIDKEFERLYDLVHEKDLETCDLLHKLENVKFNVVEGYYLSKALQDTRIERRNAKDELERLYVLRQNFQIQNNATLKKRINSAKTNLENKKQEMKKRVYNPRTEVYKDIKFGKVVVKRD